MENAVNQFFKGENAHQVQPTLMNVSKPVDTAFNNALVSPSTRGLVELYEAIEKDVPTKTDKMVHEKELRLSNPEGQLMAGDYPLLKSGVFTLNGFTNIPHSMAEYLHDNGYNDDYARYANTELDLRAQRARVSKNFLLRLREVDGVPHIRGVMSDRYGIIDHIDVIKSVFKGMPEGHHDSKVLNYFYDGDSLSGNVIIPDYVKDKASEYSVGFYICNSEIKTKVYSIKPYVYSRLDSSGYIWDKKDLVFNVNMKHVGEIEVTDLVNITREGIKAALSMGESLIVLLEQAKKIKIDNELRMIAYLCNEHKLTIKEGRLWHKNYQQSDQKGTVYGLLNALSTTATFFVDEQRDCLEKIATRMLATKINEPLQSMQDRWESVSKRSYHMDAKKVAKFEFSTV